MSNPNAAQLDAERAEKSKIPDHAPKPQDHKKKKSAEARAAEADEGFVTVEQCSVTLRIPVGGKVPLKAYAAFKAGDELEGTRLLLGEEQWEAFLAADPTMEDFAAVGNKLEESAGNP